jgi:hypothetical protein
MEAHESPALRIFRGAWWLAAVLLLMVGIWQCHGRWAWEKALSHV